ncbi:MAG TPA: aldose epimerase family protein [Candidatus Binatia bacterium]|nr:aldose epimerase family protein [Candidatus Binatia bacterium]
MASIAQQVFGQMPNGRNVELYTLANEHGVEAKIMNYGGTLVSLRAPDRNGVQADVVLGFDDFAPYLSPHPYFGALIGRYANRIAGASLTIHGKIYRLSANEGRNHLHGGRIGFDKILWDAESGESAEGPQLILSHFSRAGEEGYPGNLTVKVTYTLTAQNELRLDYSASTDQPTVINLTHHSYFNLAGAGTIHDHLLRLVAERYLPVDPELIPLGEQRSVRGTPFDFTVPRSIGSGLSANEEQLQLAGGYDHCWVLTQQSRACALAAELYEPMSGRVLTVFTTQPGIQVYSGNFLDGGIQGKQGQRYERHSGLCLETQHFPDSPNQPTFPITVLRPGENYRERTIYRFKVHQQPGQQKV